MENITILHDVTPEELKTMIIEGIKIQLDEIKKEFQPKEPTEYLTRKEVAKMLHVDVSTMHNWTKKGKLKAYYIGSRVYYKRHELEQSLNSLNSKIDFQSL